MVADQRRIYFLDGLRGWGAVFVMAYHIWVDGFPVSGGAVTLKRIFSFNGDLAVYIFFVVSGFSLTTSYFKNRDPAILGRILAGRYLRLIIPIGSISTICYVALLTGLIPAPELRPLPYNHFIVNAPSLSQFIRFHFFEVLFNFDYGKSLIFPLWTMQFEFIGSILLVVALLVSHFKGPGWLIIGLAMLGGAIASIFYLAFFIGAAFSWLHARHDTYTSNTVGASIFLLSIASSVFFFDFPDFLKLMCAVGFFSSAMYWRPLRNFLSSGLSRYLGKASFPLYLIHGVIMWTIGLNLIGKANPWVCNFLLTMSSFFFAHLLIGVDILGTVASRKFANLLLKNADSPRK